MKGFLMAGEAMGRMLGKLLALGLLVLLLASCTGRREDLLHSVKKRGMLVAGVKYDSKPFGALDTDGSLKGYDIDLMRELARRILGNPEAVEFHQVQSSTRVIALNSGSVDMVAATMTITPDREKIVDFSRPYFTAHQAVIVPENSSARALSDLDGKTILFVMGTTSEGTIKQRLPKAKYLGFKASTEALSALKAGRGDAMTTDDSILYGFLADTCGFRLLDEKLSDEPYGLALRQGEDTRAFRTLVNEHLTAMESDGTLARLKKRWVIPTTAQSTRCAR